MGIEKMNSENSTLSQSYSIGMEEISKKLKDREEEKGSMMMQIEALTATTVTQTSASSALIDEIKKHHEEEISKLANERESMQASFDKVQSDLESQLESSKLEMAVFTSSLGERDGDLEKKEDE